MTNPFVVLDTQLLLRGVTARRLTLSRKIYLAWLVGVEGQFFTFDVGILTVGEKR